MVKRCLYCYKPLEQEMVDYHPKCSKAFFGQEKAPLLKNTHEEIKKMAVQVIQSQTTLTGVQPKLSLNLESKEKGKEKKFTIVGLWGKYILKPQTELYEQLPENEDLTMHLATLAKIKTVPHSLIRFADGKLAYITKRIDRDAKGNKIPMEDLCQLAERLTEYKYKGSYEQIAKVILKYSTAPLLDLALFWEQVLFCWITGNSDMHLKNFSIYSIKKGIYTLTPCYDMLATLLVMPQDKEELALSLRGKKSKLKKEDFVYAMSHSGLNEKVIENIFNKFIRVAPRWYEFIQMSFLSASLQEAYIHLIERRIEAIKK